MIRRALAHAAEERRLDSTPGGPAAGSADGKAL